MIYRIMYKLKGSKVKEPRIAYIRSNNSLDAADNFLAFQKEVCKRNVSIELVAQTKQKEGMDIIRYEKGDYLKQQEKVKKVTLKEITKEQLDHILSILPTDYKFYKVPDKENTWYDEESEVYFEVSDDQIEQ